MKTGIKELDNIMQLEKARLIVLASRPLMGKTTFVIKMIENMEKQQKLPILYFDLEHVKQDIVKNAKQFPQSQIYIKDAQNYDIDKLCEKAKQFKLKYDAKLIVIDNLQLVGYNKKECLSRNFELAQISSKLRKLSEELRIPILIVSRIRKKCGN